MIRVVNLRQYHTNDKEVLIKVDRSTPVGNVFHMCNEGMRDEVCDMYEAYFYKKVKEAGAFHDYIIFIYKTALQHDVALGCWCAPKRCHADTIAEFVNLLLNKTTKPLQE